MTLSAGLFSKVAILLMGVAMAYGSLSTTAFGADLSGMRPDKVTRDVRLKAIARSDNGKKIGMEATIGKSFLQYRAFKGKLELTPSGKFEVDNLPAQLAPFYLKQMGKADIYRIDNADDFISSNSGKFLVTSGNIPTFVTISNGPYVDGRSAIWICILSSPTVESFYKSGAGHERCDAFRP